jgi:hypothetical protein
MLRVLFLCSLSYSAANCSSESFYSSGNKLCVSVERKRREIENILEQNNSVWKKLRWEPTCNVERNYNNLFFRDLQIHLHFRFWKLTKTFLFIFLTVLEIYELK